MLLHIDDMVTIGDLQDKFSRCYPHLKLLFCKKKHKWEETTSEDQVWTDNSLTIGEIRKNHKPGILELKSWFKVGEAEKAFQNKFDLSVQICFRSGNRWIQTGKMDNLTIYELQQQAYHERPTILL